LRVKDSVWSPWTALATASCSIIQSAHTENCP
jgi:hypothetical protein